MLNKKDLSLVITFFFFFDLSASLDVEVGCLHEGRRLLEVLHCTMQFLIQWGFSRPDFHPLVSKEWAPLEDMLTVLSRSSTFTFF